MLLPKITGKHTFETQLTLSFGNISLCISRSGNKWAFLHSFCRSWLVSTSCKKIKKKKKTKIWCFQLILPSNTMTQGSQVKVDSCNLFYTTYFCVVPSTWQRKARRDTGGLNTIITHPAALKGRCIKMPLKLHCLYLFLSSSNGCFLREWESEGFYSSPQSFFHPWPASCHEIKW